MFQGFTPETIDFMWGLRFNNEKPWFEAHKQTYRDCLETPMRSLCADLYDGMTRRHRDLPLVGRVCRVYRDARRLHGRGPYKDHLWLVLAPPVDTWSCAPTFWFELTPENYSYGLGYWMARASTMARLRSRMDRDPKPMEKLVRAFDRQEVFTLEGEDFKRPRPAPSPLLAPWYNKKHGLSMSCEKAHDDLLFSPGLPAALLSDYDLLVPLFRYLSTLDADPDPRQPA